jgi:hypothetical protein
MSLIEKIDAEIVRLEKERDLFPRWINPEKHDEADAAVKEAYRIRKIIISEQKEPCKGCKHYGNYENEVEYGYPSPCTKCKRRCVDNYQPDATDNNVVTKSGKDNNVVTIGDKIRENNESLANEIMKFGQRCCDCDYKEKPECNVKSCKDGILEYLNQPYTE